ncbi:uncharacterized protein LOC135714173 [Ochlerotatus camptorhynchus]|uniref:uncharacterized protein LOC135714173 n=1 Tax=Ochlerotatus camptorhynchus TaxID=644619 RepID=UPI0031D5F381
MAIRKRSALRKALKMKDCIRFKNILHKYPITTTNYFFVLPIHDKNKYYKQCNRQLNCEWGRRRKVELKQLEAVTSLPPYIILESACSDRVKVIAYCSLSKIPSCARRCLLEVIVRDDHCYYLNIENIFVETRDFQVMGLKFQYSFYQSKIDIREKQTNIKEYEYYYEYEQEKSPEMIKKFFVTRSPHDWITKEQSKLNEDLYFQRQNYYYYYYYNEDEDDDTYYQQRSVQPRKAYDGPPPDTSNEPYVVAPIHHHPELKEQCVRLINTEWPRSRMARFMSFETSTDTLPITLVLAQMINGENVVLGHAKLSPVLGDIDAAYLESVVVDYRYRGRGIGTHLVTEAERYCSRILNINNIYLSTDGQEVFYAKLGYMFCKAINLFGTNAIRKTPSKKHWMKKIFSDWEVEEIEDGGNSNALDKNECFLHSKKCDDEMDNCNKVVHPMLNINELIRNIRRVVYNHSFKREDTICDLLLTMHSI